MLSFHQRHGLTQTRFPPGQPTAAWRCDIALGHTVCKLIRVRDNAVTLSVVGAANHPVAVPATRRMYTSVSWCGLAQTHSASWPLACSTCRAAPNTFILSHLHRLHISLPALWPSYDTCVRVLTHTVQVEEAVCVECCFVALRQFLTTSDHFRFFHSFTACGHQVVLPGVGLFLLRISPLKVSVTVPGRCCLYM